MVAGRRSGVTVCTTGSDEELAGSSTRLHEVEESKGSRGEEELRLLPPPLLMAAAAARERIIAGERKEEGKKGRGESGKRWSRGAGVCVQECDIAERWKQRDELKTRWEKFSEESGSEDERKAKRVEEDVRRGEEGKTNEKSKEEAEEEEAEEEQGRVLSHPVSQKRPNKKITFFFIHSETRENDRALLPSSMHVISSSCTTLTGNYQQV